MLSTQSVVHRGWSGRRAVGNDRRSYLVEADTTGLIPLRQRIEIGCIEPSHELERTRAAFYPTHQSHEIVPALTRVLINHPSRSKYQHIKQIGQNIVHMMDCIE